MTKENKKVYPSVLRSLAEITPFTDEDIMYAYDYYNSSDNTINCVYNCMRTGVTPRYFIDSIKSALEYTEPICKEGLIPYILKHGTSTNTHEDVLNNQLGIKPKKKKI